MWYMCTCLYINTIRLLRCSAYFSLKYIKTLLGCRTASIFAPWWKTNWVEILFCCKWRCRCVRVCLENFGSAHISFFHCSHLNRRSGCSGRHPYKLQFVKTLMSTTKTQFSQLNRHLTQDTPPLHTPFPGWTFHDCKAFNANEIIFLTLTECKHMIELIWITCKIFKQVKV